jgi:hypothetical protein
MSELTLKRLEYFSTVAEEGKRHPRCAPSAHLATCPESPAEDA